MIWWGKEQDKKERQRGQAGENWRKGNEKEKYVWRRQRREEGKERQDRECIAYTSRALKAEKLEAYNFIRKKSANV